MKKINVLQVIYQLGDGGVESMLMDIYRNINCKNYRFIFLVQEESIKYVEEIEKMDGKVIKIEPLKKQGVIKYIKEIKKICIEEEIDVVHSHNLTQNFIVLFAAKLAKVKIRVSHSHLTSTFSIASKMLLPLIRWFTKKLSTHRLACGIEAGKFLYGNDDFLVINNAIDVNKFINAPEPNIDSKLINDKYVILHVGRLCNQKNHDYIIKIANDMRKINNDFIILCCGSGPLESEIKNKIIENKLEDNVVLLGSRNDIPSLMKIADIFILPSLYEGLPVTAIEAQAANLKCLLSDKIDKRCDLGLNLVDFLNIEGQDETWSKKIDEYKNNGYKKASKINETLKIKGYDAKYNGEKLQLIYRGEL